MFFHLYQAGSWHVVHTWMFNPETMSAFGPHITF